MSFIEDLMRKELNQVGGFMSYSVPFPGREWSDTVAAIQNGSLDMHAMISHHWPLTATPDVFAQIAARQLYHQKIILMPD